MLNTRINDFMQYCERARYYQMVALLYEKAYGGLIKSDDFYCPLNFEYERFNKLLSENTDGRIIEKHAANFIKSEALNPIFCKKLAISRGLRYLLAIGFHDVPILSAVIDKRNLKLSIDCTNTDFKPNTENSIITVQFENFKLKGENLSDFYPNKFYYDRQEIYCLDSGDLLFVIGLNNRGAEFKSIELQFTANVVNIY